MERLGIEKLKQDLLTLIKFGEKIEEALADGKLKFGEIIALVPASLEIWKQAKDFRETWKEALDLDEAERAELVAMVAGELDLTNDKAEKIIELSFQVVTEMILYLQYFKDIRVNK